ncbi:MAG: hypothetical protein QOH48_1422 [Actinomycetota bacterium]|jgi:hypothetical protein|nr:hypothetical protein [Actinomycetota bacterium]
MTYRTDLWLTLEPIEQPERAGLEVSAGPAVRGRRLSHRTIALALALLGLLALADTFFLFHLGESRRGGSLLFVGALPPTFPTTNAGRPHRGLELAVPDKSSMVTPVK